MDEAILRAVYRYRYMTLTDVTYLLFSPGALSHVRALLAALSGGDEKPGQFLYRFMLPDDKPGNPHRVYTMGRRGRDFGREVLGFTSDWYFRTSMGNFASQSFLNHQLALTKALVASEKWSIKQDTFKLEEIRTSYELAQLRQMKEAALSIPDGWLLFRKDGKKHPILLEVDLGTEKITKFKEHISARIKLIQSGKYEEIFQTQAVLIVYLTITDSYRKQLMVRWCEEVLKEMRMEEWGEVFKFGYVDISEIYSLTPFTHNIWQFPYQKTPVPLFD